MNVREMYEEGKFKEIIDHYADSVDSLDEGKRQII